METWKSVIGYEKFYEVSDQGRVRRVKTACGATVGLVLRPSKTKGGYCQVNLYREGTPHISRIHRLVLMAFVGLPKPGQEGNHKDGIKGYNRPDNLEWLTHKENCLHRNRVLGLGRGKKHYKAKLTNKDIPIIRRLLARGNLPQRAIGTMFGVSQHTIWQVKYGKSWAHI